MILHNKKQNRIFVLAEKLFSLTPLRDTGSPEPPGLPKAVHFKGEKHNQKQLIG